MQARFAPWLTHSATRCVDCSDASPRKPTRGKSETQSGQAKNAGGDNADTDSDGTSDFIAGRDLQSLLFRFFMRLNKIDSVVFPDAVKSKITSIKEAHQVRHRSVNCLCACVSSGVFVCACAFCGEGESLVLADSHHHQ